MGEQPDSDSGVLIIAGEIVEQCSFRIPELHLGCRDGTFKAIFRPWRLTYGIGRFAVTAKVASDDNVITGKGWHPVIPKAA